MDDELEPAFQALSDDTRREILRLLQRRRLSAGEIAEEFDVSKPSISHHLKELKRAGLVSSERDGQRVIYALETTVLQDVGRWLFDLVPGDSNEFDFEEVSSE